MISSILSLPVDNASELDEYAIRVSNSFSPLLKKHYEWTQKTFPDADRSSSLLQAHWMQQQASGKRAQRILDIGCYTGLSALAWYEGTKETGAKIYTIEYDANLAATSQESFSKYGCDDRIRVIQSRAEDAIGQMTEPFDIIFVDLDFTAYRPIVEQILDRGLLAKDGIILVDNVFARGFAVSTKNTANIDPVKLDHWIEAGRLVQDFNSFVAADARVIVTVLPFFDGISEIRLKQ